MVVALPIATWELALGVWLTFKGFTTPTVGLTDDHENVNRSVDHVFA